jgi:RNA polymerase sigma-70 factor (ECF subfamily)
VEYQLMAKPLTDAELLARVPAADALDAFYSRHVDVVFRFAVRRCRNADDVADLVSTVFLELFSAAASYDRRRDDARPWLLGIAARCLADQCRRGHRSHEVAQKLAVMPRFSEDEQDRVNSTLDAARAAPAIEDALVAQLTPAERELFLLVAYDELSVAQAARSLGLTPVAGRMRLARARKKLRAAVGQEDAPGIDDRSTILTSPGEP